MAGHNPHPNNLQHLVDIIYPILHPYEFALLSKSVEDQNGPGYRLKYGELIRKFRIVEEKRFINITIYPESSNIDIHFGKGKNQYCSTDLPGSTKSSESNKQNNKPSVYPDLDTVLLAKLESFIDTATGFFDNEDQFWLELHNSVKLSESC